MQTGISFDTQLKTAVTLYKMIAILNQTFLSLPGHKVPEIPTVPLRKALSSKKIEITRKTGNLFILRLPFCNPENQKCIFTRSALTLYSVETVSRAPLSSKWTTTLFKRLNTYNWKSSLSQQSRNPLTTSFTLRAVCLNITLIEFFMLCPCIFTS